MNQANQIGSEENKNSSHEQRVEIEPAFAEYNISKRSQPPLQGEKVR